MKITLDKGRIAFLMAFISLVWINVQADPGDEAAPDYRYVKRQKITTSTLPLPPGEFKVEVAIDSIAANEDKIEIESPDNAKAAADNLTEVIEVSEEPETQTVDTETEYEIVEVDDPKKIEEFSREMETVDFVPKGQWIFGLSVSYTQSNQDKYQFLILEGISGNTYSFKISPTVMFAVKADLALGGRFSYNRSLTKVASADIVLDSETDYSFDHLYRLSHNYYGAAVMRNYFSLGKSTRFGIFNEVSLQMGGGQTKLTTGVGEDLTGTYERNFSLNVGLTPGISIFLSNYSALEVNVGLLGFNYTDTKAVKDQIYVSHRNSKSANFRINLFSITFGATFYL